MGPCLFAFRFHRMVVELDNPTIFPDLTIEAVFFFERRISFSKTARCHTIKLSTGYRRNLNMISV